jgi:hypothetical protein
MKTGAVSNLPPRTFGIVSSFVSANGRTRPVASFGFRVFPY